MRENFISELKKIQSYENYDGWMYTTDDWTIGYLYSCEECGGYILGYTDLVIPYNSTNDEEFNDILNELNIDYIAKAHWIYDDYDTMCHCGDEEYEEDEDDEE